MIGPLPRRFPARTTALAARALLAGLCALALAIVPVRAFAQAFLDSFWEANGWVNGVATAGRTVYLAGDFNYVGPRTGPLVGLDPATGARMAGFPTVAGQIYTSAPDGDGGWYIAGYFQSVAGEARSGFAHIRADMTLDSWAPDAGGVECILRQGDRLYVGGNFGTIDGQAREHLACFDLTTHQLLPWNPGVQSGNGNSGEVLTLAADGSRIYVGGWFSFCGGQPREGIACVDANTAAVTDWDPGVDGSVALAVVPHGGVVFVGGAFSTLGGQPRGGLAEIDATTGLATAWQPLAAAQINALVIDGNTLYVGGGFSQFDGVARSGLAAVDLPSRSVAGWDPGIDGFIQCAAVSGGTLYTAGSFEHASGVRRHCAAAFTIPTGILTAWDPRPAGNVMTLTPGAAAIALGGFLNSVGGVARHGLAAIDATTGEATNWDPDANDRVVGVAAEGSKVYASGYFTRIGGQDRSRLAQLDAATGLATAWTATPDDNVSFVTPAGSRVYVGGPFRHVGGVARNRLAALDATTGALTPWAPVINSDAYVNVMTRNATTLFVGGYLTTVDGQARHQLAAFDLASGALQPLDPNVAGNVFALAVDGSELHIGGYFGSVGGQLRSNYAVVDAVTGALRAGSVPGNSVVRSIALGRKMIYVAADFTNLSGLDGSLTAIDRATGQATGWNPIPGYPNSGNLHMAASVDTLYVGGGFSQIAGRPCLDFAAFAERIDVSPPVVQVMFPNGGENLVIGQTAQLRWSATDDVEVAECLAYVSRLGPNGPWQLVGSGLDGCSWRVTGPASSNAWLRVTATDRSGHTASDLGNAAFSILSADPVPPSVQVIAPNGLEDLAIGDVVTLQWTATDNVGVTQVNLSLSRSGPAGPWELIGPSVPNDGSFAWRVAAPECLLSGYLRIEAFDAAGNSASDTSDQPFSIVTRPVPTFVELLRATPTVLGVKIEWRLADPASVRSVELQRSVSNSGEWTRVAAPQRSEGASTTVLDDQAPAGASLGYRLSGVDRAGAPFVTAPVEVDALAPVTEFALATPAPNPTAGRATVSFALPVTSTVRLALVDVQGREVAVLTDREHEAGRYTASLDASDLRAGLYFIRMAAGHVTLTRRLILVR